MKIVEKGGKCFSSCKIKYENFSAHLFQILSYL